MIKKLCTTFADLYNSCAFIGAALLLLTVMMRRLSEEKDSGRFLVLLGKAESSSMRTPLICFPSSTNTEGVIGLPNGGTDNSGDLNRYLNIGSLNNNSLVNSAGIEGKYFLSGQLGHQFPV